MDYGRYYPYYRATPDYAYETAIKAELKARKAEYTANAARGLHKDLDERTREIEKRVAKLEDNQKIRDLLLAKPAPAFTPIFSDPKKALELLEVIDANLTKIEGQYNLQTMTRVELGCTPKHVSRLKAMAAGSQSSDNAVNELSLLRDDFEGLSRDHSGYWFVTIPRLLDTLKKLEDLVPALQPPKPKEPTKAELITKYKKAVEEIKQTSVSGYSYYSGGYSSGVAVMVDWTLAVLRAIEKAPE